MKEALSIIASAWSVAFVVLFILCIESDRPPDQTLDFILLVLAVTGAGWLWYRHKLKEDRK